jgi:hypothetical protein
MGPGRVAPSAVERTDGGQHFELRPRHQLRAFLRNQWAGFWGLPARRSFLAGQGHKALHSPTQANAHLCGELLERHGREARALHQSNIVGNPEGPIALDVERLFPVAAGRG